MDTQAIFALQFITSIVAWGLVAKWLFAPRLDKAGLTTALFWLTLPHAFRHVGMAFLVPGVAGANLPTSFAVPAAYGDLATGLLALLALVALRSRWSAALGLVWTFNIVGTIDLVTALRNVGVAPLFGAVWFIPTMLVPLLLVTHFMMFARLAEHARQRWMAFRARAAS